MKNITQILILFLIIPGCQSFTPKPKEQISYIDSGKTTALCLDCKALKNLPKTIEHLEIEDWKCKRIHGDVFQLPSLKRLIINCKKVDFPTQAPKDLLGIEKVSILSPILDSVPDFIYQASNLRQLILFLRNDRNLSSKKMSLLNQATNIKIGIQRLEEIPNFVYELESLKELIIFSNEYSQDIKLDDSLSRLQNLVVLEVPIDLGSHIDLLKSLSELRRLRVSSYLDLNYESKSLEQLRTLEEICIENIPPEKKAVVRELLPNVKFICRDEHILPLNWTQPHK